jgi:hypothetical protein
MIVLALNIHCFLYCVLCTLSEADVVLRHYRKEPSRDNKVSNVSLNAEHHAVSLNECSTKCDELCACFGFNPRLEKCRIHQSCDPSDMTVNEAGWGYYCPDGMLLCIKYFKISSHSFEFYP